MATGSPALHGLKGIFATVGAEDFTKSWRRLESLGDRGEMPAVSRGAVSRATGLGAFAPSAGRMLGA